MSVLLGTIFFASLLGSLHCVGMCGPFALMAGSPSKQPSMENRHGSAIVPAAAYSLGRLVTYMIVGVAFGGLGMALNRGISFTTWQQSATYLAGGLMVVVGSIALFRHFGLSIKLPSMAGPFQRVLQSQFESVNRRPRLQRAWLIGALTCLMPCGWLYTFAIVAAGTGSIFWGPVVMAVFWAGTVPVMVALMLGWNKIGQSIQKRIPVAMACLVIFIGLFTIAFRAPVTIGSETRVFNQTDLLIEQVRDIDQAELPCCED